MPFRRIFVGTTVLVLALVTGGAFAATGGLPLGPSSTMKARDFKGYYDGHKDTFLVTDVSNRAQARALHVNFSRAIGKVKGCSGAVLRPRQGGARAALRLRLGTG
jgi:hypothetical protein